MTEREREILELLREDPLISQKDLAVRLGIERSSVAVHIANLTKKGWIQGKGYIIKNSEQVVVIGGSNVDIAGRAAALKTSDSAQGTIRISAGGVGRNIAEGCSRLGAQVTLLSAVGSDAHGELILKACRQAAVDVSLVHVDHTLPTSAYMALLDNSGDMLYAINDMAAIDAISPNYIKANAGQIKHARVVVVDANLSELSLETISLMAHPRLIADPVSTVKAIKLFPILKGLYGIKPNRYEAEILSGIAITDTESALNALKWFHEQGVQHVVLSLGHEGLIASDGKTAIHMAQPTIAMVNATGAGDVFIGAWAAYSAQEMDFFDCVRRAIMAARFNVTSEATIHEALCLEQITTDLKEVPLHETVLRHSS